MNRIFLLSPASTKGKRAQFLLRPEANFELAKKLRDEQATIGEVFSFLSGLYFRGKNSYAQYFGTYSSSFHKGLVITAGLGLIPLTDIMTIETMTWFSQVSISLSNPNYLNPLEFHLKQLKSHLSEEDEVILLGSVATGKYVEPLLKYLGKQLLFPKAFKGLGDMSRGALMLKAIKGNQELEYASLYPNGVHKKPGRLRKSAQT